MNITELKISDLKVEEPYKSLFRIDENILSAIQENMQKKGFDRSRHIDVWVRRNRKARSHQIINQI